LIVTLAESLAGFGSDSFSADLVAVFVIAPGCVTVATSVSVAEPPLAIAPMFQSPVPLV
jgi:hypothetical protein